MFNKQILTLKQDILDATKGGFLFYKSIIPNLMVKENNVSCKSVRNPFYNDSNPSLSIYYWNGQWRFKDFGDESYAGNVFEFAGTLYGIDPDDEIELLLATMWKHIDRFDETTINSWVQPNILNKDNDFVKVKFNDRKSIDFTSDELSYWNQYGIDGATLDKHRVVALDSYSIQHDEDLLPTFKERPAGKMWFAYKGDNFGKIYSPNPKAFWYVGIKPVDYTFGTPFDNYPETQDVILAAGEKDALSLIAHGYNAITLNSETSDFTPKQKKNLFNSRMRITSVLYDNDETGVRRSKELSKTFNCPSVELPCWLKDVGGKDVSDFFKHGGTISELNQIIGEAVSNRLLPAPTSQRKSVRTASQRMEDAKNMPEIYKMFDVFLHSGELGILFGDTGIGKSILAVAIADAVSRGSNLLSLENQCDPCKVIYYDFELSDKQFQKRYSDEDGTMHMFSDNLFTDNVDFTQLVTDRQYKFENALLDKIKQDIIDTDAKLIVIDNITFLSAQTSSDVQVAMELMKLLKQLKTELGVTILVLAHTPKRQASQSLTINDLAGSKQLSNFADTVFAIGVSAADSGHRYVKQVKPSRSGELVYDKSNVLKCELQREESDESLLTFKFIEFCDEASLLADSLDMESLKEEALRLRATVPGITIRQIGQQLGVSKTTVGRWVQ
ncbi:AAA family ATPase [Mucilaginibacter rigui]|uniref:AAA family ATPase n=1 Tax=Mucilaginibacter rigui TaxID=534635 RepID=A0ABR7WZH3_9SPHI|nr:AAA family ATPase [Mucilaginibacter rigui]MBD1383740.1 AAA family ATPase [Mucilaginibacter rigui]